MRISRRTETTLNWVESAWHPITGGLRAWQDRNGQWIDYTYPEVTGYMIPTLLKYGRDELARKCADWVGKMMVERGGLPGVTVSERYVFDTAMGCVGLRSAYSAFDDQKYLDAYAVGLRFLRPRIKHAGDKSYMIKAFAELGYIAPEWHERFKLAWPWPHTQERSHYMAYAMEGLRQMGISSHPIKMKLSELEKPYSFSYTQKWERHNGVCPVGNLQLSIILDDEALFDHIDTTYWQANGGIGTQDNFLLWTARYYLEAAYAFGRHKSA